jgi:hypothetical protein
MTESNVIEIEEGKVHLAALGEFPTRPDGYHLIHASFKDWTVQGSRTPVSGFVQFIVSADGSIRIHGYPAVRRTDRWGVDAPDATRRRVFRFLEDAIEAEVRDPGSTWLTDGSARKRATDRKLLMDRAKNAITTHRALLAEVEKLDLGQTYDASLAEGMFR